MGYTIGEAFVVPFFVEDESGLSVVDPPFAVGDVKYLAESGEYEPTANLPEVTGGTSRAELTITAAEANRESLMLRIRDQTSPTAWAEMFIELHHEPACEPGTTTQPNPTSPVQAANDPIGSYIASAASGLKKVEQGTKRAEKFSPSEMRDLAQLAREEKALARRRRSGAGGGMIRQIVD